MEVRVYWKDGDGDGWVEETVESGTDQRSTEGVISRN